MPPPVLHGTGTTPATSSRFMLAVTVADRKVPGVGSATDRAIGDLAAKVRELTSAAAP